MYPAGICVKRGKARKKQKGLADDKPFSILTKSTCARMNAIEC
jgi:hypothetical protein